MADDKTKRAPQDAKLISLRYCAAGPPAMLSPFA